MSLLQTNAASKGIDRGDYPTSDGRPMGETDLHRSEMFDAIETLKMLFKGQKVYVTGNLLLYYKPGNRRRHVSPDVMVVKGIDPHPRDNYLLWEEGEAPNVVIEVTSESTKEEDVDEKYEIYRDQIKVAEYFLFDPRSEYLSPSLQGYRLSRGAFAPITPVEGRLPSQELGLHLEKVGTMLRFFDPGLRRWIPTIHEVSEQAEAARKEAEAARKSSESARKEAEAAQQEAEAARQEEEAARRIEAEARQKAEAEVERLRREIERLRGGGTNAKHS